MSTLVRTPNVSEISRPAEAGKHRAVRRYRFRRQRIVSSVVECRKSTSGICGSGRTARDDGRAKQPSQQEPPAHARGVMLDSIHFVHLLQTLMSVIFRK